MKEIVLTQGQVALVDDEDFEYLNQWKWCAAKSKNTYYVHRCEQHQRVKKTIRMHRVIMDTPKGIEVDHKDHNGLNNQKYNLRNCTEHQNSMNKKLYPNTSSKYKGVAWDKGRQKWRAYISLNRKRINLGRFVSEIEAALCRDYKARELFGEFAPKPNIAHLPIIKRGLLPMTDYIHGTEKTNET